MRWLRSTGSFASTDTRLRCQALPYAAPPSGNEASFFLNSKKLKNVTFANCATATNETHKVQARICESVLIHDQGLQALHMLTCYCGETVRSLCNHETPADRNHS